MAVRDKNDLIGKMRRSIGDLVEDDKPHTWTQLNYDCFPGAFEAMGVMSDNLEAQVMDAFQDIE
jgi:hypothetical protein